jgi:hypothetical protein
LLIGCVAIGFSSDTTDDSQSFCSFSALINFTVFHGADSSRFSPGLLISNIDIDIDSINDTSGVSISVSTILLSHDIESSIDENFKGVFSDISISILSS